MHLLSYCCCCWCMAKIVVCLSLMLHTDLYVCVCVCVCMCVCVCVCVCMCVCVCVCVWERAREREKEREKDRDRERVCVCMYWYFQHLTHFIKSYMFIKKKTVAHWSPDRHLHQLFISNNLFLKTTNSELFTLQDFFQDGQWVNDNLFSSACGLVLHYSSYVQTHQPTCGKSHIKEKQCTVVGKPAINTFSQKTFT